MERTLLLIKPDAIQRELIGEIIHRFERKGLKLVGIKMLQLSDTLLDEHYNHLVGKPFFTQIKEFMKSTPVIACCWEGSDCTAVVRNMCGATISREAVVGTVRGDFGLSILANLVHSSDSKENAENELKRFFNQSELFFYKQANENNLYSPEELQ